MNSSPTCRPSVRHHRLAIAFGLSLAAYGMPLQAANPVFSVVGALKIDRPSQSGTAMNTDVMNTGLGMTMNTYHFDLSGLAPGYSATLSDTGLFGAGPIGMALLSPSMKLMGHQIGSGTFGFTANESGIYTLVVAGRPSAPTNFDAYAAQVTAVPEAGRAAMLLTGLGLMSLQLRRRRYPSRAVPQ